MTRSIPTSSVTPGTVVAFTYNGGSNPGSIRIVSIKEAPIGHIKGDDLMATPDENKSTFRDFLTHKIATPILLVADRNEEVIPVTSLVGPGVKIDGALAEALFRHNHPDRKAVRYDAVAGVLVARPNNIPRIEFNVTADKIHLNVVNEDGEDLGIFWEHSSYSPTNGPVECRMDQATLAEFAGKLLAHSGTKPTVTIGTFQAKQDEWSDYVCQQAASGHPFYSDR